MQYLYLPLIFGIALYLVYFSWSCAIERQHALRTGVPSNLLRTRVPPHEEFCRNLSTAMTQTYWHDDPQCSQYDVRLGVRIPLMYLVSFPRSGNSWTRYLLEGSTGIFTGSIGASNKAYALGLLGGHENHTAGTVLTVKSHKYIPGQYDPLTPVILIIRNPRPVIASLNIFHNGGQDQLLRRGSKQEFETKKEFSRMVNVTIGGWKRVALQTLSSVTYLHVTYYEDLKANPLSELLKMLHFLRVSPSPDRLACLTRHMEGSANKGQPKFDPYTEDQEAIIRAAVREVSAALQRNRFPPLPYATQ